MFALHREHRPGGRCSRRSGPAARKPCGGTLGRLAPGASADILTFRADHPTLAGKADDQILDAWIFSVGNPLVDCVWSRGLKVVVDGQHIFRDEIAAGFAKTMRGLS